MAMEKIRKDELIIVGSEITEEGIVIKTGKKEYKISYPRDMWKRFSAANKELLLDNLTFMKTMHLPAAMGKKSIVYETALPFFETFAYKSTMLDIPSTATIDNQKTTDYMKSFFNTKFVFSSYDAVLPDFGKKAKTSSKKKPAALILFTAGKESLLTLGMCLELGIRPILIYIDEDPESSESKHKELILEELKQDYGLEVIKIRNEAAKLRFICGDDVNWGAGVQFLSYTLMVLPVAQQYDADYVFFGNEYGCDLYQYDKEGFRSLFWSDQSQEATKLMNIVSQTMTKGNLEVGSLVGPLQEIAVTKVLHERYPGLAKLQMSCFCDDQKTETRWCADCSKCATMYTHFKALGIDETRVGFPKDMFTKESKEHFVVFGNTENYSYDGSDILSEDQALGLYMAMKRGAKGEVLEEFSKTKAYKYVDDNFKKRFAEQFTAYETITLPYDLRAKVMDIIESTLEGTALPRYFRLKQPSESEVVEIDNN